MANTPEMFFSQIEKDPQDGCWIWNGPRYFNMYGIAWQPVRLAYRLTRRPYAGRCVIACPKSDSCINPEHARLVSRKEQNSLLASRRKGRPLLARISKERALLDYAGGMTVRAIADKYSVTPETASTRIRSNFPDWPSVPEIRRRIKHQRPSAVEALERARQALDNGPTT